MWDRPLLSFGIGSAHTEHRKRKGGGVYDRSGAFSVLVRGDLWKE